MTDVAVIGGGLAGLACAVALAERGLAPTLLEASGRLGGRAASWRHPGVGDVVDTGPHIFHTEYRNMLAFLDRLGTRDLISWQSDEVLTIASKPRPTVLRQGRLPAPFGLVPSVLRAPGLGLRDYLSMARTGWRGMRFGEEQVEALDRICALDFLRRQGVSEAMIDWWWRFAAMVVANVPLERCSSASLMRIHAQLSGYRGLQFGFAKVGLGDLFNEQAAQAVRRAGGRVAAGVPAVRLLGEGRIEGVLLADGSRIAARQVVSALPPHELFMLLSPGWRQRAPFDALPRFEPSPYISVYLWFDRRLPMPRFWTHLHSPERLNYDFYDLRQIRAGWEGRPSVVASNIIHSHRAAHLDDAAIVRATVDELAEFVPMARQARVVHVDVHRLPMGIPCPVVGFESMRPAPRSPLPGLTLAGDWVQTHMPCTMEGAVKSGFMAAEAVLAERGVQAQLAQHARMYDNLAGLARRLRWRTPPGAMP